VGEGGIQVLSYVLKHRERDEGNMEPGDRIEITACIGGYITKYRNTTRDTAIAGDTFESRPLQFFPNWASLVADLQAHCLRGETS
jgi:hypothetical protein